MNKIRVFVTDVDGTLTDGRINISATGEAFKSFDVKDGYGIQMLRNHGIIPAIITGRESDIVVERCKELGITNLYQGVSEKSDILREIAKKYDLKYEEIAYIGDDINDIECIKLCGYTGCPADAVDEVKQSVSFISSKKGGNGAVREFIEAILGSMKKNK